MHLRLKEASVVTLLVLSVSAARADSLAEFARNAHRSSVQSIHQLSCKVEFHYHGGYEENVTPQDFTLNTAPRLLEERASWQDLMPAPQVLSPILIDEGQEIPVARVQAMHEGKRRARGRRS